MVVRIRFHNGPRLRRRERKNQHVALATAALLTPAALTAFALGLWRLAADLRIAGQFAIADGLFSHWQVWLAVGALIQCVSIVLNRYGQDDGVLQNSEEEAPKTLLNSGF